jgi:hypothetical protein
VPKFGIIVHIPVDSGRSPAAQPEQAGGAA